MPVSILYILLIAGTISLVSGLTKVNASFLFAPILLIYELPMNVVVATCNTLVIGAALPGAIIHYRRGNIDFSILLPLLAGAVLGTDLSRSLTQTLIALGYYDFTVWVCYLVLLGVAAIAILSSAILAMRTRSPASGNSSFIKPLARLPIRTRFRFIRLTMNPLISLLLGAVAAGFSTFMGVGADLLLLPALDALLMVSINVATGTSLLFVVFVGSIFCLVHSAQLHSIDVYLLALMLIGSTLIAPLGVYFSRFRVVARLFPILGLIVAALAVRLVLSAIVPPSDVFSLSAAR
jgi:uncharacterized membrane protein YfcA